MADARRAALKAELRKEIDSSSRLLAHTKSSFPKTGNPEHRIVVPTLGQTLREESNANASAGSGTNSPRRSDSFNKNFHSTAAVSCIRNVPTRVEYTASPQRGPSSPARKSRASSPVSQAAKAVLPVTASAESDVLTVKRAGPIARSALYHHPGIVLPAEASQSESHNKLWLRKPLADGTRHAQTKRLFPERRSDSPLRGIGPAASDVSEEPSQHRRTDSPGGRRRIDVSDNLSGPSATVVREQPAPVTGRKHEHRSDSPRVAPYFENAAERDPNSQRRDAGLLGYGPTGKAHFVKPDDHPHLLDDDNGKTGPEPVSRGVRLVGGKSHRSLNMLALHEHAKEEVRDREEAFRPSIMVMQGPPPFVPPPLPPRTNSPRRGAARMGDNDIFHTQPAVPQASSTTPLHIGRGIGRYSPARQDRPF
jgi:hypothetical protein